MTTLKNKVLHILDGNTIHMIPKWKFVLYSSFGVIGLIFSFLSLLFVASLIIFLLSKYGFMYLPLFGFGATLHALTGIPVILGVLGLVLVFITELLSRHFAFSFRTPLVTALLVIIITALGIGFVVSLTPFHSMMRGYMRINHINGFSAIYERPEFNKERKGRAVLRGVVVATTSNSLILSLFNDEENTVYATTTGEQFTSVQVGDDLVVFGIISNGRFEVMRIRTAPLFPFEERTEKGMRKPRGLKQENQMNYRSEIKHEGVR